jgi:hypothetical protein
MIRTAFAGRQVAPCSAANMLSSSKLRGAISLVLGALPRRRTGHLARAVPMGAAWVSSTVASPPTVVIRLCRFQFKLSARLAREANGNRAGRLRNPAFESTHRTASSDVWRQPVGTLCERLMGVLECLVD